MSIHNSEKFEKNKQKEKIFRKVSEFMIGYFEIRTDLALEASESLRREQDSLNGVRIQEDHDSKNDIHTTTVTIETENSARMIGKPAGCYITMEVPEMLSEDDGYHREISAALSEKVLQVLPAGSSHILLIGLGNRDVTPDALGPCVIDNLNITRHLTKEFGFLKKNQMEISALVPGVMAQTGMETLEIIQGVCHQTRPDTVIVIDALAARSTKRLNRTIQLADTGIHPGSGVGNHRCEITKKTLGTPVIAIGVPTVVDAATIVYDSIDQMQLEEEQMQLLLEKMAPGLNTMFVSPKDIDAAVKRISYTISEGLNLAFASDSNRKDGLS